MELTQRITSRVAELTGEVELLRKQLAEAEHELERLVIAGQVITQLTADDAANAGEPAAAGPPQRGFGLLVPPRGQASSLEANVGAQVARSPFICGHTSAFYTAMASSSRSIAWRTGTWQDQPCRRSSVHTPSTVYPTRNNLPISILIRLSVQR